MGRENIAGKNAVHPLLVITVPIIVITIRFLSSMCRDYVTIDLPGLASFSFSNVIIITSNRFILMYMGKIASDKVEYW